MDAKTHLKKIEQPVKSLIAETTRVIIEQIQSNVSAIDHINEIAPVSKGKKIRSTLLFLLTGASGTMPPILAKTAASIEMFHLSSLIHDDIVDNTDLRRGELTLHMNLGNHMSVLWGDFLFITAFSLLNSLNQPILMDIILKAADQMVQGQIIELANAFNFKLQRQSYYDIIYKKTASLFAAVTQMAAALHGEPEEIQQQYYDFGIQFGTIFQVSDDMLDIFSEQSGKDRYSDLREGKITLPYILLLEHCNSDISQHLSQKDGDTLLPFFERCRIKEHAMEEIDHYYRQALDFLSVLPNSKYKESLLELLEFIKYRDY